MAVPQAQLMLGLPTALALDGVNQLVDEAAYAPAQGGLQQLDQSVLIQAKGSQAGCDEALHCWASSKSYPSS